MTTIDVQPSIYYTAASSLHTYAANLFTLFDGKADTLDTCSSMAGSYDEAKTWAAGYDRSSYQALDSMYALAETMDAYAGTLRTLGHNHEMADWNANTSTGKGAAPTKPADPMPAAWECRKPPPSSGGPSNGLTDAIHLAEKVGITIPDGDLTKLATIAGVWTTLHTDKALSGLHEGIGRIISAISLIRSPEASQVVEDLQSMQTSANTLLAGCGDIATSCHSHHDDLSTLRDQLKKQLEDLAKDFLEQEAITLTIGVAASFLTFGAGAVIAAGRTAELVDKFAGPIREMVTVWIKARKAKKEANAAETLASQAKKTATCWDGSRKPNQKRRKTPRRRRKTPRTKSPTTANLSPTTIYKH